MIGYFFAVVHPSVTQLEVIIKMYKKRLCQCVTKMHTSAKAHLMNRAKPLERGSTINVIYSFNSEIWEQYTSRTHHLT